MDTNEFIVRLVEALAWPVAALVIALLFRTHIVDLIRSVGTLKLRGVELEFDKGLEKAEEDARHLNLPPAGQLEAIPETLSPRTFYEQTMQLASLAPRAAVTEAWRAVEVATMQVAQAHDIPVRGTIAGIRVIQSLVEQEKLDGATLGLYSSLRRLRNQAAHSPRMELGSEEAVRYVDLALSLVSRLQELADLQREAST